MIFNFSSTLVVAAELWDTVELNPLETEFLPKLVNEKNVHVLDTIPCEKAMGLVPTTASVVMGQQTYADTLARLVEDHPLPNLLGKLTDYFKKYKNRNKAYEDFVNNLLGSKEKK